MPIFYFICKHFRFEYIHKKICRFYQKKFCGFSYYQKWNRISSNFLKIRSSPINLPLGLGYMICPTQNLGPFGFWRLVDTNKQIPRQTDKQSILGSGGLQGGLSRGAWGFRPPPIRSCLFRLMFSTFRNAMKNNVTTHNCSVANIWFVRHFLVVI